MCCHAPFAPLRRGKSTAGRGRTGRTARISGESDSPGGPRRKITVFLQKPFDRVRPPAYIHPSPTDGEGRKRLRALLLVGDSFLDLSHREYAEGMRRRRRAKRHACSYVCVSWICFRNFLGCKSSGRPEATCQSTQVTCERELEY